MKRIAYAEDLQPLRELYVERFREILRKHGINADIDEAVDGRELGKLVVTGDYDLVFTDIDMPNIPGTIAIDYIRTHCPDIPIYVLAYGKEKDTEYFMQIGANGYIDKNPDTSYEPIEKAILEHLSD